MASRRRSGPTRSIFMMTEVDHVRPWFRPNATLAAMIQPQLGAQMSRRGTGRPISQPATRTGLRPMRSDRVPAEEVVAAFTAPKARMKLNAALEAWGWNARVGDERAHG